MLRIEPSNAKSGQLRPWLVTYSGCIEKRYLQSLYPPENAVFDMGGGARPPKGPLCEPLADRTVPLTTRENNTGTQCRRCCICLRHMLDYPTHLVIHSNFVDALVPTASCYPFPLSEVKHNGLKIEPARLADFPDITLPSVRASRPRRTELFVLFLLPCNASALFSLLFVLLNFVSLPSRRAATDESISQHDHISSPPPSSFLQSPTLDTPLQLEVHSQTYDDVLLLRLQDAPTRQSLARGGYRYGNTGLTVWTSGSVAVSIELRNLVPERTFTIG